MLGGRDSVLRSQTCLDAAQLRRPPEPATVRRKSTERCVQHAVHVRASRALHSAGSGAEAAAARAGALTKLLLRMRELPGAGAGAANRASAESMLAIAAMLLLGESAALPHPADADSVDRMVTCLQARAPPRARGVHLPFGRHW